MIGGRDVGTDEDDSSDGSDGGFGGGASSSDTDDGDVHHRPPPVRAGRSQRTLRWMALRGCMPEGLGTASYALSSHR